jgi:putative aldouronate transport system substrate-binding protein
MNKRIAAIAVALTGSLALASCSSPAPEPEERTTQDISVQRPGLVEIPEDNVIQQRLEEELDINLSLSAVSAPDYYAQLSAAMAAGDAPDVFVVDRARLDQYAQQGQVLDLSQYLEGDALADYTAAVGDTSLPLAQVDGATYALPSRPTVNYSTYWIRQDWLDALGLDIPETVDELLEVAEAFTTDDPDGSGSDDTYGITGGRTGSMWTPLWGAFGSAGLATYGSNGGTFSVDDGEVVNSISDPHTQDALEFIREMIDAGVVDPDYMTIEEVNAQEKAMQGTAGIIYGEWTTMTRADFIEQYKSLNPDAEWVQLGALTGPEGEGAIPRDEVRVDMWAISSALANDEQKVERILDLFNYVSTEEGSLLTSYGIEGEHYTVDDDGTIVGTDLLASEGGYFWVYQFTGRNEQEYLETKFASQSEFVEFAASMPLFPTYNSLVIAPEMYNVADAGAYAQQGIVQFVTGQRPLSEYDNFLDELDSVFDQQDYVDAATEQLEEAGVVD